MRLNNLTNKTTKLLPNDFVETTKLVQKAVLTGWEKGKQTSRVSSKGLIGDIFTRSKCITQEIKELEINSKNIPIFAAAIAYIAPIPIPGLTLYTYVIAKSITSVSKYINRQKSNPLNKTDINTQI